MTESDAMVCGPKCVLQYFCRARVGVGHLGALSNVFAWV